MSVQQLSGQKLGDYELHEALGRGGMGAVYRAYQTKLDRDVALKVVLYDDELGGTNRFIREVRLVASLEHPNIVPIYDFGVEGNLAYVSMRLLGGGSLTNRLKAQRALSVSYVYNCLNALTSALDYAHSRGIIHRDIKPSNILFDEHGTLYVADFGIAKMLSPYATQVTAEGLVVGTPMYMSPEQWQDKDVSAASDQYALAIVVYQMLTGQLPFTAESPMALMSKHVAGTIPNITTLRPDLPHELIFVLERALAKNPKDRYNNIKDFARAFAFALKQRKIASKHDKSLPFDEQMQTIAQTRFEQPATIAMQVETFPEKPKPEYPPKNDDSFARWLTKLILSTVGRAVVTTIVIAIVLGFQALFFFALADSNFNFGQAVFLMGERLSAFFSNFLP